MTAAGSPPRDSAGSASPPRHQLSRRLARSGPARVAPPDAPRPAITVAYRQVFSFQNARTRSPHPEMSSGSRMGGATALRATSQDRSPDHDPPAPAGSTTRSQRRYLLRSVVLRKKQP